MKTLTLAHYYTTPEVQAMADYVGDSLDLALKAAEIQPDRLVFAGVKFMAETAKILCPNTEVILPDAGSTCSLVTQTDLIDLKRWALKSHKKFGYHNTVHVMYINSSAAMKEQADIIVTSRIVDDVVAKLYKMGKKVIFSPDANMGKYLNYEYKYNMPVYSSVCEVHDKFKGEEIEELYKGVDGLKYLLAHPESPLPILKKADYIGSTHGMLNWVKNLPHVKATIFVATEEGLLYNMKEIRPELDIRQAPTYSGCQCNQCPYMKLNTPVNVLKAQNGIGTVIDYMSEEEMAAARKPITRMLQYQSTGEIDLS